MCEQSSSWLDIVPRSYREWPVGRFRPAKRSRLVRGMDSMLDCTTHVCLVPERLSLLSLGPAGKSGATSVLQAGDIRSSDT